MLLKRVVVADSAMKSVKRAVDDVSFSAAANR